MTALVLLLTLAASPVEPLLAESIADCCADKLAWTDLSGQEQELDAYRGRIVVLNFWATWCLPCHEEMPALVEIQNRYGIYGVRVVGAAADDLDKRQEVLELARALKLNFPVLLGANATQMGVLGLEEALPSTVILDVEQKIVRRFPGVFDPAEIEQVLDDLLDRDEPIRRAAVAHDQDHDHDHGAGGGGASLVPS